MAKKDKETNGQRLKLQKRVLSFLEALKKLKKWINILNLIEDHTYFTLLSNFVPFSDCKNSSRHILSHTSSIPGYSFFLNCWLEPLDFNLKMLITIFTLSPCALVLFLSIKAPYRTQKASGKLAILNWRLQLAKQIKYSWRIRLVWFDLRRRKRKRLWWHLNEDGEWRKEGKGRMRRQRPHFAVKQSVLGWESEE